LAKIPTLEPRVSPGIARDPGLNYQDNSALFENVARASENVLDLSLKTQRAERRQKYDEANVSLARDTNQFMLDNMDDPEPETLPQRFTDFYQAKQSELSSKLDPVDAKPFLERASLAGQDFEIKVKGQAIKARQDRVMASANGFVGKLSEDFAITEDPEARNNMLVMGLDRIDALLEDGVITAVAHEKMTGDFIDKTLMGRANLMMERDPKSLLNIEQDPTFADMDPSAKLTVRVKAENEVERLAKQAEQQRKLDEREYLVGLDTFTRAIQNGVTVSPVLAAQYTDRNIEANIADPEMRSVVKATRDVAIASQNDVNALLSLPADQHADYLAKIENDAKLPVSTAGGASIAMMQMDRLANATKAASAIQEARVKDPVAVAVKSSDVVSSAWATFASQPTPETYMRYRNSVAQYYDDMNTPGPSQRVLPKSYAASIAADINSKYGSDPESSAARMAELKDSFGDDWARAFSEMQAGGLTPEAAQIGYVSSPVAQQTLISVARNGGVKAINERLDNDQKKTLNETINDEYKTAFRMAGAANGDFMTGMRDTTYSIAASLVDRGVSETDAARQATEMTLASNFTIVDEDRIQGMISPDIQVNSEQLGKGSRMWFLSQYSDSTTAKDQLVALLDNTPIETFGVSKVNVSMGLVSQLAVPGTRPEDAMDTARDIIANSAYFTMSADGKMAVLTTDVMGLPQSVPGEDGRPIQIPLATLERIGTQVMAREQKARTTGIDPARKPSGNPLQNLFEANKKMDGGVERVPGDGSIPK
jgi:hypothetical protein